jgi:hypothetical protein
VKVDRPLGDARRAGEVVDGGLVVAPAEDTYCRGVDDLLRAARRDAWMPSVYEMAFLDYEGL